MVSEIIAAGIVDGDLNERTEGASRVFYPAGGMFDAKIEDDASPGFMRPGKE